MLSRILAIVLVLAGAAGGPSHAEGVLLLQDGREIEAVEIERHGDEYLATLPGGDTVVLPAVLVKSVKLAGAGPGAETAAGEESAEGADTAGQLAGPSLAGPKSGLVRTEAETLAGPSLPETARGEPRTLAGPDVQFSDSTEQFAVFRNPVQFQKDVVRNDWRPSSDWVADPERNNFAPSTWAPNIVNSEWKPASAWDTSQDVMASNRSTWQPSVIDNTWTPKDGFAR